MLRPLSIRRRGLWAAAVLSVALVGVLLPSRMFAQKSLRETTSLEFVPADVSFYASSLRNREKFEAFVGSKAFAAIQKMPMVKMGIAMAMAKLNGGPSAKDVEGAEPGPGGPLSLIKPLLKDRKLLELLMDMASDEIFVYGDQEYGNLLQLYSQVTSEINAAQYERLFSGNFDPGDDPMQPYRAALRKLNKDIDKLKVPTTVIGFRIKNTDNAAAQLARLEKLIAGAAAEQPLLKKSFKREKIGDTEFLVIRGDGSMIPWDEIPWAAIEENEGEFDAIVAKIKKLTVAVSLGVHGNYLLLSIAPGTDHLLALGKGKLLIDRPEMAPLLKAAGKRISAMGYVSDHYARSAGGGMQSIDAVLNGAMKGISRNIEIDGDLKKGLEVDLVLLRKDILSFIPKAAGMTSYAFMTDRGFEGYLYNRSEDLYGDGSKRLSILDHVGGSPLFFFAGRQKYSTRGYDTMIKWIKKGKFYFEAIVLDELDDDESDQYEVFVETFEPLLKRAHRTTRDKLMPALKDGQVALVFDGSLKAKQWASNMPPAKTPLALPAIALVRGVSNAPLLKEAMHEYVAIAKETVEAARELADGEIPDFEFPELRTRKFGKGDNTFEVFYYKVPKFPKSGGPDRLKFEKKLFREDGDDGDEDQEYVTVHKWLAPNVGLSSKFAVLSFMPRHTKKLLESQSLSINSGPLARRNQPLVSASYVNWAGMVDLALPWIDYGFDMARQARQEELAEFGVDPDAKIGDIAKQEDAKQEAIRSQVHEVANILKCFRDYSSVTYQDAAGNNVTHYEVRIQDLP